LWECDGWGSGQDPTGGPDPGLWLIYTPRAGCAEGSTVPLGSIWCFDLGEPPAKTAVEGPNSWVDDFAVDELMLKFDDGDLGYRIFDDTGAAAGRSKHWINRNR
jgi:hypothetical protein